MSQQTPAEETATLAYEAEPDDGWPDDEPEIEAPRRPRRKLLAPVPVALMAVLVTACGFLAGVEVEKGQGSSTAGGGLPSALAALRGGTGTTSRGNGGSSSGAAFPGAAGGGFPGAGGLAAGGLTTGEVSYVKGSTLYVTSGEGDTVKVSAPKGTTVSKTVATNVRSVHPGDTVIVRGSQNKNGSVTASSISISAAGGASSSSSSSTSGSGSGGGGGGAAQQLFGSG